jgi:hypothetical protein
VQGNVSHREPLAELEKARFSEHIALAGLPQKIDVQIRCHGKHGGPDRGKHGRIHRRIGEREHGWPRNRAAGPEQAIAEAHPDARKAMARLFDLKGAPNGRLRENPGKERIHLRRRKLGFQGLCGHAIASHSVSVILPRLNAKRMCHPFWIRIGKKERQAWAILKISSAESFSVWLWPFLEPLIP